MKVHELIAALRKEPPELEVRIWDHDADDWMPVVEALYEDGSSSVDLLTYESGAYPAPPETEGHVPPEHLGVGPYPPLDPDIPVIRGEARRVESAPDTKEET